MRFSEHLQSLGKTALQHLVYSNVYIALLAIAALWQSSLLLETTLPWPLIGLVFFATLAHYNLDRLLEYQHFSASTQTRLQWLGQRNKALVVFTLLAVLATTYFLSLQTTAVVRWVALLVLLALAYSLFFSGIKKQRKLAALGALKPLLIGFVWMGMGPGLLLVALQSPVANHWPWLLSNVLFFSALYLPFDYRDRDQDHEKGIQTLALRLPNVAYGRVLLALLLVHWALFNFSFPAYALWLLPTTAFAMWLSLHSLNRNKEWLYIFGIDGLIGLQAICIDLQHYWR